MIALLGAGKLAEALLSGMLRAGHAPADLLVTVRRPQRGEELAARYGVGVASNADAAAKADVLLLTVKPQDMAILLAEIADVVTRDRLVVSMAAGTPTSAIERRLAPGHR